MSYLCEFPVLSSHLECSFPFAHLHWLKLLSLRLSSKDTPPQVSSQLWLVLFVVLLFAPGHGHTHTLPRCLTPGVPVLHTSPLSRAAILTASFGLPTSRRRVRVTQMQLPSPHPAPPRLEHLLCAGTVRSAGAGNLHSKYPFSFLQTKDIGPERLVSVGGSPLEAMALYRTRVPPVRRSELCGVRRGHFQKTYLLKSVHQSHLQEELKLKHRVPGPTPRVSDSVPLDWDLRTCISNKFSGDSWAASLGDYTLRTMALVRCC